MPISLVVPLSSKICRDFTSNGGLYRAKAISNLWNFRFISYMSFFTAVGISNNKFDVSKDYLVDLKYLPQ